MNIKPTYEELKKKNEALEGEVANLKQKLEELNYSQDYLEKLIGYANVPIIIWDAETQITLFNPAFENLTGFISNEVIGQKLNRLFPESSRKESLQKINNALRGEYWKSVEIPILHKNGSILTLLWNSASICEKDSTDILFTIAQGYDITHLKKIQFEMAQKEDRLSTILDNSPITIWCFDGEKYSFISKEWYRFTGQDPSLPLTVERWVESVHPDDQEKSGEIWEKNWNSKTAHSNFFRLRSANGTYRSIQCYAVPIFDKTGTFHYFQGYNFDITDQVEGNKAREELEDQLLQAQKLESIGVLAGGIAHDFNNILVPIIGLTEMLLEKNLDIKINTKLNGILTAGKRARDLVSQILVFSRKHHKEPELLLLQSIVKETINLSRASFPSNIKIKQQIDKSCDFVLVDVAQFHQVVMNLITNAFHSMEELGGVLTISLEQRTITQKNIGAEGLTPGEYVCLIVKDTGTGISPQILGNIFEPYFTTKTQSKGTGLGLAVTHGIVKTLGGEITVESEIGKGSCFSVYFQAAKKQPPKHQVYIQPEEKKIKGMAENILIIDDEKAITNVLKMMLTSFGYKVEELNNSKTALKMFKKSPDKYDLIITDLTMPGLTGDMLCSEIYKIRPKTPVILLTGFNEKKILKNKQTLGIDRILTKPVTKKELLTTINRLIG